MCLENVAESAAAIFGLVWPSDYYNLWSRYPLVAVAPEGTTKFKHCLLRFSKGAFLPGQPVLPILFKYRHKHFNCGWGLCNTPLHMVRPCFLSGVRLPLQTEDRDGTDNLSVTCLQYRMITQFVNHLELEILEPYLPSEEEKVNPWLYSENVRQLMAERLGCPMVNQGASEHDALYKAGVLMNNSWTGIVGPSNGTIKVTRKIA